MNKTFRLSLCTALVALFMTACAASQLPVVIFPLPPDPPRIQWLGTFASQDDFLKSGSQNFLVGLAGKAPLATFQSPFGIVADSRGLIYIADALDENVRVYDMEKKEVNYYSKERYFSQPFGLAIDSADNLYVVDNKKKAVLVFDADRQPLRTIGGPELLVNPTFVEVDSLRDRVYVSDSGGNKIVVFNRAGEKIREIGPKLGESESLYNPQGAAVDKDGNLFITEMLRARITVVTPDGEFVRTFGTRGDAIYEFEAPKDLAFDSDGNLWVADNRRSQFYAYTPKGELLLAVGSSSRMDTSAISFSSPTSIYVDGRDRVLVTDRLNRRFMAWQYRSASYEAAHPLTEGQKSALESAAAKGEELMNKKQAPEKP